MATKFGTAAEKATRNVADKEYAEDHYKKEAAKVKEIELEPKQVVGKKFGGKVKKAHLRPRLLARAQLPGPSLCGFIKPVT
jgi:hypothetical protein